MNKAKTSFFSPTIGSDSTGFDTAVITPPKQSKILEYALPAAAVLESILTQGKSPGTASLSALGNLSAGQDKYQSLLKQQETAKTGALERKAKEQELGYKQTAEERAASSEQRAAAGEQDKQKERDEQEKFASMFRKQKQDNPTDPTNLSDDQIDYFSRNRGEYYKNKSAELPAPTPAIAATLKDPVLKELAAQAQKNPAAAAQFWKEYASKYEAQAAAAAKTKEGAEGKDLKAQMDIDKLLTKNYVLPFEKISNATATARQSVEAKNPILDEAMKTSLARMSGEVGALSNQDIARYSGSPQWTNQFNRFLSKGLKGKMTEDDRSLLRNLIDVYETAAVRKYAEKLIKEKDKYGKLGKDISDLVDSYMPDNVETQIDDETGETFVRIRPNVVPGIDPRNAASWLKWK